MLDRMGRIAIIASMFIAATLGAQAANPVVKVDLRQAYRVNGHVQVQKNVFGATAYEGATLPALGPEGEGVLRQSGITCLGFPGMLEWCSPEEQPDTTDALLQWYGSEAAISMIRDRRIDGDRYMYGKVLPGCRNLGIEPMVYLLNGPKWALEAHDLPADFEQYAAMIEGYVGLLKRFDPGLRLFHLMNEPNASWFKSNKSGQDYARLFSVVARRLKAKYPDIKLGGPVTCWPPAWPPSQEGQPNWYTWDQWTLPLLKACGKQLDFFDFHLYEKPENLTQVAQEEVALVSNEMLNRLGRRVPVAISECNTDLTAREWLDPFSHWKKRTFPYARFLFAMLEQPDKVGIVQMHDLMARTSGTYQIIGDDWRSMVNQAPTYWLFWIFRHTRGARLAVAQPPIDGLRVFATRSGSETAVLFLNDSDALRRIDVRLGGVPASAQVKWDWLALDVAANQLSRGTGSGRTVSVPARGLTVAYVPTPAKLPIKAVRERLEFAGDSVMQEFSGKGDTRTIAVSIPALALHGAYEARVRIGTLGNQPGDRITLLAGKQSYRLQEGVYFQEIYLKGLPSSGKCPLRFRLDTQRTPHRLRISSASVTIERRTGG